MGRGTMVRGLAAALLGGTALAGAPAHAAHEIHPYLEVDQVLDADLTGDGDVLTYTTLSAGIDGSVSTERAEATVSYRYDRQIPWDGKYGQNDVHSGLARGRLALVPGKLNLEAGAIATRARSDIRGADPVLFGFDDDNVTQVYGVYAGPSFSDTIGELQVAAAYQFGYVKAEADDDVVLAPGQPRLDLYDDATTHNLFGSVGMATGNSLLPVGWTVSAGWQREDAGQLDQRFDSKYGRLDLVLPVSDTVALTAGVGYEDIETSERAALRNPDGSVVVDDDGRFVTDPDSPRLLSYDTDGITYDGGVIWRPDRRTTAQLRVGRRYGGTMVVGSFEHQISAHSGIQAGIYYGVESFGRSLINGLATLPTAFDVNPNPLTRDFTGCVFGTNPGTGGCLDQTFQSIATSNYRMRGASILYSARTGVWNLGLGGGYARRTYLAPVSGAFFSVAGIKDESAYLEANANRRLTENSRLDLDLLGSWYKSGIFNAGDVYGLGATGSYYRNFGDHLTGRAAVGVYTYDQEGFDTFVNGQLLVGVRYDF